MTVFRAYDIRGIYPSEINEQLAERVGRAFGTLLAEESPHPRIAVGGDVRTSTPPLKERLIRGLLSTGAHILDLGMVSTPMLYFAVASLHLAGGMAVTASHNPKEYNGLKPVGRGGACLSWETGISRLKELADAGSFRQGTGTLQHRDITDAYIAHVTNAIRLTRRLRVVVDAANGACSLVAPRVFERLGCEVIPLFCEPDGRFPNHEADPIKKKNLAALQQAVRENGADLGIAYDADGDRLGIVNDRGEVVENNTIFSLFAKDILRQRPGAPVVYEVVVSKVVEDVIRTHGGRPILSRVGHSYIQSALNQHQAALAGENSGHYYFPENFGYDDAVFASLRVAELLNTAPLSVREQEIPRYHTSEEFRPPCADDRKFRVVAELQQAFKDNGYDVVDIDGARVTLDGGWFIIRASNTGPQLVVRWEAEDASSFASIGSLVKQQLAARGVALDGP